MVSQPQPPTVADDVPERPPTGGLAQALDMPRNAVIGAAVGLALTVVAYLFRVLRLFGPFASTREYPILGPEDWFLLLAFVLASVTALLVVTVLTLVPVCRLGKTF